jgi:Ribbon-helix-helix protein, copG family
MNFNIYVNDELGHKLTSFAQIEGKSRNALIREALDYYFAQKSYITWSDSILDFQGINDFSGFEELRTELKEPDNNVFA